MTVLVFIAILALASGTASITAGCRMMMLGGVQFFPGLFYAGIGLTIAALGLALILPC